VSRLPALRDLAELVRLPAALTVPGDVLAGAAAAGWPARRRAWALPAASVSMYWAGMALNDYADRELDRVERPERPLPTGRVTPGQALGTASALTVVGLALAGLAGGRPALGLAVPLAGVVWSYDLVLKDTRFGPGAMAAARGLDVLLGASGRPGAASVPALALATHTAGVTALSRGEVNGSRAVTAGAAAATTGVIATTVALTGKNASRRSRIAAAALALTYAAVVGRAQAAAVASPDSRTVRAATGAGIRGMIPLQAALMARAGAVGPAAVLVAAEPASRLAFKVVSAT
jgi:hypothetical protein